MLLVIVDVEDSLSLLLALEDKYDVAFDFFFYSSFLILICSN